MPRAPLFSSPSLRTLLAHFTLGLALAGGAFGCSSSSASCAVTFSGGIAESGTVAAGCGTLTLASADAGAADGADAGAAQPRGYRLALTASSKSVTNLDVDIGLGDTPTVGMFSSDTITDWSAIGVSTNGCGYGAGTEAVPVGSFTLNLTDVSKTTPPTVHGTLDMTLYVHAPPMTDCGPSETEAVSLAF